MPPRSSARALGDRAARARRLDRRGEPGGGHPGVDGGAEPVGVGVGGRERGVEVVAEAGHPGAHVEQPAVHHDALGGQRRHVQVPGAARQHGVAAAVRRSPAGQGVHRPRQHAQPVHPPVRVTAPVAAGERLVPTDGQVHGPSGRGQLARDLLPGRARPHHEHRARRQAVRVAVVARVQGGHRQLQVRHVRHAQLPGRDDHVARRQRPSGGLQHPAVPAGLHPRHGHAAAHRRGERPRVAREERRGLGAGHEPLRVRPGVGVPG